MHRLLNKLEDRLRSGPGGPPSSSSSTSSSPSPSRTTRSCKPSASTKTPQSKCLALPPACCDIRHRKSPSTSPVPVPLMLVPVSAPRPRSTPPNKQRQTQNSPRPREPRSVRPSSQTKHALQRANEKRQNYMLNLVLGSVDLEKYVPVLLQHGINYLDFLRLTPADLIDIGIKRVKDRQKIFKCIDYLTNPPQTLQAQRDNLPNLQTRSPASPLRIQRNGTISPTMQIQMLNNIWAHLLALAGVGRPSASIFLDKVGNEYKLDIASLHQHIIIPENFRLNHGIQISDLIDASESVLGRAETLAVAFRSLQQELKTISNGFGAVEAPLANEGKTGPWGENHGIQSAMSEDIPHASASSTNCGFYRIFTKANLELGFGLICCIGLLFVKKHA